MEKLKRLREERNLSQVKLAARADLNPATVNQIERGMRNPSPGTLRKLADALEVSLYELLEEDSPKGERRSSLEPSFNDVIAEERRSPYLEAWKRYIARRALTWLHQARDEKSPFFADWKVAIRYVREVTGEAFTIMHVVAKEIQPAIEREAPSLEWQVREYEELLNAIQSMEPVLEELHAREEAVTARAGVEEAEQREIERTRAEADRLARERREAFEVLQGRIGA